MNEIKRGVEMAVRTPMMKLPEIPFSDMYLKDLWELEVEDPEDFSRRVGAVRSGAHTSVGSSKTKTILASSSLEKASIQRVA